MKLDTLSKKIEKFIFMEPFHLGYGCKIIIRRMHARDICGGKHLPERIILSWIKNLQKEDHREAIRDWKECKKINLILQKSKPGEMEVSINPRLRWLVEELVKK